MNTSLNDRAMKAALAVLGIITDAEDGPELPPGELQCRVWRYLCDEFDDIARQIAGEQQETAS